MERKTGLEPATPTLARLCSTTELLPHLLNSDIIISQFCLLSSLIFFGSNRCKSWHFSDVWYCIISFTSCQQEIFIQSRCLFRCQHSRCATKSIIYDSAVFCKGIFEKNFRNGFQGKVRQAADISPLRPAPAAPSEKKAMWNNDHLIFAFHLPRGTCSSHRSDRETLSQLSFMP